MTDYLNLTFNSERSNPSTTTNADHSTTTTTTTTNGISTTVTRCHESREDADGVRPGRLGSTSEVEVSANVTSTTSMVISGGEGHDYLMRLGENVSKEAKLLMWQVSN